MMVAEMPISEQTERDTAEWTRTESDRRAVANGCVFDLAAAERVRRFFEKYLRHSKGRWAGKPFVLEERQWRDIIAPLFGWKRADGTRRYRRAYIEIPKKNGKSTLSSGIELYLLVADGEEGPEVYSGANDRAQAGIVFNEAANMVRQSPRLTTMLEVIPSQKRIIYPTKYGFLQALSADVATKEGLNAHGIIFDELHAQPNRKMFDTLWYAGAARDQPLFVMITTAGHDRHSICWEQHEYAQGVLDDSRPDEEFFAYIAAADPKDDWTKEETWAKANPSYGVTIKPEEMAAACREAQNTPAKENSFRRYRLNQWTEQETRWLSLESWDACSEPVRSNLKGLHCTGGLDLAKVGDLTAFVLAFDDEDAVDLLPFFFIPEDVAKAKELKDKVPYRQWAREGFITLTPGNVTDYRAIRDKVNESRKLYKLDEVAFDPWNASHLAQEITDEDGFKGMIEFGQNIKNFNEPTQHLEKLVVSKKVRHSAHPILRWNAGNVTVKTDWSGNIRPVKPEHTSALRIDGIVATIMAVSRLLLKPKPKQSVYEKREVRFL
jgi:phage terminase large subunit-like protein